MLEIGDETHHNKLRGKSLSSVYRFSDNQWNCILHGGKLLQIRFRDGILGMTISDTEYGLGEEIMIVGIDEGWENNRHSRTAGFSKDDLSKMGKEEFLEALLIGAISNKKQKKKFRKPLSFLEIMDFMSWKCKEENIWDCSIK